MKARYIGGESEAGSRSTKLFGITVYCDQVFDVPAGFENKALLNPYVEVIEERPKSAPAEAPADATPTKTRKRKEKDNGEPIA